MEPGCNLLGDIGSVARVPLVDNEVDLDLVLYGFIHNFSGILDHLRVQHSADRLVNREGFGIGFLIAHPKGSDKPDGYLLSGVKKFPLTLVNRFRSGGSQVQ
jgi:hypothetical protein